MQQSVKDREATRTMYNLKLFLLLYPNSIYIFLWRRLVTLKKNYLTVLTILQMPFFFN